MKKVGTLAHIAWFCEGRVSGKNVSFEDGGLGEINGWE